MRIVRTANDTATSAFRHFVASLLNAMCGQLSRVRVYHLMRALLLIVAIYASLVTVLYVPRLLRAYRPLSTPPSLLRLQSHLIKTTRHDSTRRAELRIRGLSTWLPLRSNLSITTASSHKNITSRSRNRIYATSSSQRTLSRVTADGAVLLLPALVGRLGNQTFSWSAAWGLARHLSAAFAGQLVVRPVIPRESELYRLFGEQLDGVAVSKNELKRFKQEPSKETNALYDGTLLQRLVKRVRNGHRGVFALCCYQQSWRYFHSAAASDTDFDSFSLLRQFQFPPAVRSFANRYIGNLKRRVNDSYFNTSHWNYSIFNQTRLRLQFNSSAQLSIDWLTSINDTAARRVVFVAVHMRLTDHQKQQRSKIPNREFYLLAGVLSTRRCTLFQLFPICMNSLN